MSGSFSGRFSRKMLCTFLCIILASAAILVHFLLPNASEPVQPVISEPLQSIYSVLITLMLTFQAARIKLSFGMVVARFVSAFRVQADTPALL